MVSTCSRFHRDSAKTAERKYSVEVLHELIPQFRMNNREQWVSCLMHANGSYDELSLRTCIGLISSQSANSMSSIPISCGTSVWAVPVIRILTVSGMVKRMIMHITNNVNNYIDRYINHIYNTAPYIIEISKCLIIKYLGRINWYWMERIRRR